MFSNKEVKELVIVCDKDEMEFAEYMLQLISLEDDGDGDDEIVGCPDGSIKASIWDEAKYLDNLPTMTSNVKVLFIGDSKPAMNVLPNIDVKYSNHTIQYGWLGNKAVISIPNKGKMTEDEYGLFKNGSVAEREEMDLAVKAKSAALIGLVGVGTGLIGLSVYAGIKGLKNSKKKHHIEDELYRFAVLHFYMNAIRDFMGV